MKLYYNDRSPYCIAVLRALQADGFEPEIVEVPITDRSSVIKATDGAYYMIPMIEDDGELVYETGPHSQDIASFLDRRYFDGKLFPGANQGVQRILLHYLEQDVENVTFRIGDVFYLPTVADVVERTMVIRYKERKFGIGCVERWRAELDKLVDESRDLLLPFEQMLATGREPFLLSSAPVYADFLLFGVLGNYTYQGLVPFPRELPRLAAWNNVMQTYSYRGRGAT